MKARRLAVLALAFVLALVLALAPSCRPDLGERESLVVRTEVLAVQGEPAEVKPGESVHYRLLVASPGGPIAAPIASWAFCATPKLLTENGAASAACLSSGVRPIAGAATEVDAVTPGDACAVFGPEVTSADLRPRDPDITGGFFQPVRVVVRDADAAIALGQERLACKLGNANADIATDFGKRYVRNLNPELSDVVALRDGDGAPVAFDAVPRGARITLRASWPEAAAELYVTYDVVARQLVTRREALRVSWFVTAGTLDQDRTGRGEDERELFTDDGWTAPDDARTTHVFVVLRDSRGGVAFTTREIATR